MNIGMNAAASVNVDTLESTECAMFVLNIHLMIAPLIPAFVTLDIISQMKEFWHCPTKVK
jgi:hypothetical protein